MSYCRFSTDDYQCDVYCYESVGDFFAIHVAGSRYVYDEPLPPRIPFDQEHLKEWIERDRVVMSMVSRARLEPIGLPHDGESFDEPTAAVAAERLEYLRDLGYRVPQGAIDALRAEVSEDTSNG